MSKYTREEIEAIKAKPPELRTPKERGLANLVSWKPGQSGNPTGKNNWRMKTMAEAAQKLLNSEQFLKTIVKSNPKEWDNIVEGTATDVIIAGLIAGVLRDVSKSLADGKPLSKETRTAIMQLNKLGFGEQVTHKLDEGFFQQAQINFNVVEDRKKEAEEEPDGEQQPQ